jgi:predicted ThiF/HesA family dinucleotide-utilizing enzyme
MSVNITEDEFYESLWFRSSMVFTPKERKLLKEAKVGIIGVGGTGGIASEQLVRSGVGNITLVDPDIFELSNINRQHFCTISTIGMKKTEAGKRRLLDVNPFLNIKTYPEGISKNNAKEIVKDLDVIIDASDNKSAHYPLHRFAKKFKVPIISRSHSVPEFTFGAKANLWDYRKDNIKTREEEENSKTVSMNLEDIKESDFREKDKMVHEEFNRIYKDIFRSKYSNKLLLSENEPSEDFFNRYEKEREYLVQGTNWGPVVTLTGTFFATVAINIIIGSKDIFLGPISIKRDSKIPIEIEQKEIR